MRTPDTRYAKSGEIHIAYQVVGSGTFDLVVVSGFITHLDLQWEQVSYAAFLERLASFCRLILFDPRGAGLSDRMPELPTLEEQMDDVNAVLDAVGAERAAIFGISQGGQMAALYAATFPQRATALVLYGANPAVFRNDDYPWGRTPRFVQSYVEDIKARWGTGVFLPRFAPSKVGDEQFRDWWVRFERSAASPGNALAWVRMHLQIDIRQVLPTIRVPTLVIHRKHDSFRQPGTSRYIAEHISGARYMEVDGSDHLPYVGDARVIADEVEEFLTGIRRAAEPDRMLATVLFTDIVGSSERAAALGDRSWRELLEAHHAAIRRELARFRGLEVDTAGDGFLATFDGPARAIRCAAASVQAVERLGLEIRAGVHTGEVEMMGANVGGIAVHIGARVASLAGPGEVLVSSTVKDLVAGSGVEFEDRGSHVLKGIPGEWRIFAAKT